MNWILIFAMCGHWFWSPCVYNYKLEPSKLRCLIDATEASNIGASAVRCYNLEGKEFE
jgi:hypothetical protein